MKVKSLNTFNLPAEVPIQIVVLDMSHKSHKPMTALRCVQHHMWFGPLSSYLRLDALLKWGDPEPFGSWSNQGRVQGGSILFCLKLIILFYKTTELKEALDWFSNWKQEACRNSTNLQWERTAHSETDWPPNSFQILCSGSHQPASAEEMQTAN